MTRPSRTTYLIWVPIALVALALLAWAVLSGFPFSRDESLQTTTTSNPPVVQEPKAATTATVTAIKDPTGAMPPPVITEEPAPSKMPESPIKRVVNEEQAISFLHSFISARGNVSTDCLVLLSEGFRNGVYTVSARDRCKKKPVGRWRLDANTREVFRQNASGKFVAP